METDTMRVLHHPILGELGQDDYVEIIVDGKSFRQRAARRSRRR